MIDAALLLSRLPAFVRERDRELGGPLQALLAIVAEQGAIVEADIQRLYDNWFIETCEPWVVPYIGDLLGVRGFHAVVGQGARGQRGYVANTLRARRRKGTVPVLEQLAFDATGWRARAVEFFQLLGTTQNVNHVRLGNVRSPDLRDATQLERIDGPFDRAAYSAEVRALPEGRYNIPNIGLFVWRLSAYSVGRTRARKATTLPGFYCFDPIGRSGSEDGTLAAGTLFNRPRTELEITHLAEPINVPEPLSRRVLHEELSSVRQALTDGEAPTLAYFDSHGGGAVLRIWLDNVEVPPEHLVVCNLTPLPAAAPEEWRRPPVSVTVEASRATRPSRVFPAAAHEFLVGFDPVLGRIALPEGKDATVVEVGYSYGFAGDVGGGPYDRRPTLAEDEPEDGLLAASDFDVVLRVPGDHATLAAALAAVPSGSRTIVRLLGDAVHETGPALDLPDTHLAIQADNQTRPFLIGDFTLKGNANTRLSLSGIFLHGALRLSSVLRQVDLRHCSLTPAQGGIIIRGVPSELELKLSRVLAGKVEADNAIGGFSARSSILDDPAGVALTLPGTPANLDRVTIFGSSSVGALVASNSIFTDAVVAKRRQEGCVRFCYLADGSKTPRRHRCQPDLVIKDLPSALAHSERVRVTPAFTSSRFGDGAYGQLRRTTAPEIRSGADDGAEMGVWNLLQEAQREANLHQALDEYLRFGLEASAIFVN